MRYIHQGTAGVKIILRTGVDISGVSTLRIYYYKPDGTSGYWAAEALTSTRIYYTLLSSNIDILGDWQVQAYAVIDGNARWGDIARFRVKPTLA